MKNFIQHLTLEGDFKITIPVTHLPHYRGEPYEIEVKSALNNFESIDIGNYAEEKDENFIYETVSYTREHDVASEMVSKRTGIDCVYLTNFKKGKIKLKPEEEDILARYLIEYGYSLEDFINFKPKKKIKYNRVILANEDFYWLMGFMLLRAEFLRGAIHFFFYSSEMNILKKLKFVLKNLELEFMEYSEAFGNKKRIIIKNAAFCKWAETIFDKTESKVFLPGDYLPVQEKKIQAFIDGLVESRRRKSAEKKKLEVVTTSPTLYCQLNVLLLYLGYSPKLKKRLSHNLVNPPSYKISWLNVRVHKKEHQFLTIKEEKTEEVK